MKELPKYNLDSYNYYLPSKSKLPYHSITIPKIAQPPKKSPQFGPIFQLVNPQITPPLPIPFLKLLGQPH